jgi:hypothetical protein
MKVDPDNHVGYFSRIWDNIAFWWQELHLVRLGSSMKHSYCNHDYENDDSYYHGQETSEHYGCTNHEQNYADGN